MVPVGTAAKASWCPAISRCWSCRRTARSSIRSSGFGTICAVTGSPTRCFPAWRTSWRPARWPGTGLPTTTAWSARSARSPGLRLRPLCRAACYRTVVCDRKYTQLRKFPEIRITTSSNIILSRIYQRPYHLGVHFRQLSPPESDKPPRKTARGSSEQAVRIQPHGLEDQRHAVRDVVLAADPIGARRISAAAAAALVWPHRLVCRVIGVSEFVILRLRDPPGGDAEPPPKADAFAF